MVIQVCGTGSGVGKSVIVSALCRIFLQDGLRPCPFKAQNMALNSFVTADGKEMGRAQAVQAQAAGLVPCADMNPILLKPMSDRRAQVVVSGIPARNMSVYEYVRYKKTAESIVLSSFRHLSGQYDTMVIEGAGSPAEINLSSHDIVNIRMAMRVHSPVILVGDIDKGGVFAWLSGTLDLLKPEEKKTVKGFIINKFRGDKRLLKPGLDFLERKTGVRVLGVIPYFKDIKIPEEDSVPLEKQAYAERGGGAVDIAVINLPHISNFTDFDPLENEPDVSLRYVGCGDDLGRPDVIIIPGSKSTISDLDYLKKTGMSGRIAEAFERNRDLVLVGVCGGYQMLGRRIYDRKSVESKRRMSGGLGFLPVVTYFDGNKTLAQVSGEEVSTGLKVRGYEIHHGKSVISGKKAAPVFKVGGCRGEGIRFDGAGLEGGRVWGTYIHGLFDSGGFRRDFLNRVRARMGFSSLKPVSQDAENEFDKLAFLVRRNIKMDLLYSIMEAGL